MGKRFKALIGAGVLVGLLGFSGIGLAQNWCKERSIRSWKQTSVQMKARVLKNLAARGLISKQASRDISGRRAIKELLYLRAQHARGKRKLSNEQKLWLGRGLIMLRNLPPNIRNKIRNRIEQRKRKMESRSPNGAISRRWHGIMRNRAFRNRIPRHFGFFVRDMMMRLNHRIPGHKSKLNLKEQKNSSVTY